MKRPKVFREHEVQFMVGGVEVYRGTAVHRVRGLREIFCTDQQLTPREAATKRSAEANAVRHQIRHH